MSVLQYLLVSLGMMAVVYLFYRHSFLKKPKRKRPYKPHFTLKVEGDQT